MWIADGWKEYEVIDCSEGEKLERWGKYTLLRPDPQVIWNTKKEDKHWKHLNAHYHRSKKGGGEWEFFDLPKQWDIHYRSLTFHLKPFSFKHTGLFPEQAVNWDWFLIRLKKQVVGQGTEFICLYRWSDISSRSVRCFRYSCRCLKRNGYMGKRERSGIRSWRCTDSMACR